LTNIIGWCITIIILFVLMVSFIENFSELLVDLINSQNKGFRKNKIL
jgi:hypothetical protein